MQREQKKQMMGQSWTTWQFPTLTSFIERTGSKRPGPSLCLRGGLHPKIQMRLDVPED